MGGGKGCGGKGNISRILILASLTHKLEIGFITSTSVVRACSTRVVISSFFQSTLNVPRGT